MTEIHRHRARGAARHYAGLLGPAGAAAGRVVAERGLPLRVARVKGAVRSRRARTEPMRALVAGPGGRLRWRQARAPRPPGPRGANVRPLAMATCDLDRPLMLGATPFPLPLQLGHECVAEVIAVGGEVRTVVPGQRVVVPFQISCGSCPPCLAGRTGNCAAVPPASMYGFGVAGGLWGGVIADQLAVPFADAMLVPLPDSIDVVAAASVADNVSDGYRHVAPYLPALLAEDAAAQVLIVGAPSAPAVFTSSVGLYAGLVARALGAGNVAIVDARRAVRDRAGQLGLVAVEPDEVRSVNAARLVIDVSASRAGFSLALARAAPDGIVSCAGGLSRSVRVPLLRSFGRNVTIHIGRSNARTVIPGVLEMMTDGRLQPQRVATLTAPVSDAVDALREHCRDDAIKTILTA
jgi:alcohol dehydrogenase